MFTDEKIPQETRSTRTESLHTKFETYQGVFNAEATRERTNNLSHGEAEGFLDLIPEVPSFALWVDLAKEDTYYNSTQENQYRHEDNNLRL